MFDPNIVSAIICSHFDVCILTKYFFTDQPIAEIKDPTSNAVGGKGRCEGEGDEHNTSTHENSKRSNKTFKHVARVVPLIPAGSFSAEDPDSGWMASVKIKSKVKSFSLKVL